MKTSKLLTQSRIEALVVLAGSVAYIWEGYRLPAFFRMPGVPGPTVFPTILGVIMGAAALWLFFAPGPEEAPKAPQSPGEHPGVRWQFYLMWGLLLGYVFLMPVLGFVVASSLLLAALFFLLGEKRWHVGIPLAVAFSLLIYLVFAKGLQVRLPAGVLEGLWR
jgi:putative tricarboxylic transport membrane protein